MKDVLCNTETDEKNLFLVIKKLGPVSPKEKKGEKAS